MRARDRIRMQFAILDHALGRAGDELLFVLILMVTIIAGPFAIVALLRWAYEWIVRIFS